MADTYYLQHPRYQTFYKILALLIDFNALGKQIWWGYDEPRFRRIFKVNRTLIVIVAPATFFSQILYLYMKYSELPLNIRGVILSILPVNGLVIALIISSKQNSYKYIMKDFIDKIHLYNVASGDPFARKKLIQCEKNTRRAAYFMGFFLMFDWIAWCALTGFNNYNNRELIKNQTARLETVIYTVWPFDYEYTYRNWFIVHSINVYFVWIGCIVIVIHNTTNYAFIFHLIGHIHILKHKLKTQFAGKCSDDEIRDQLVEVIKYHSFVLRIFRDSQSAFGLNVSSNYFYNLIADSLLLYQIVFGDKGNIIMYGCMVVAYLGGLILLSFILEEIRRQSDDLSILVYNLDWEDMSLSNKKMVRLMLLKMQPALVFKAAGGLRAGVRPMLSIIKSTFSYYVILKSSMN